MTFGEESRRFPFGKEELWVLGEREGATLGGGPAPPDWGPGVISGRGELCVGSGFDRGRSWGDIFCLNL